MLALLKNYIAWFYFMEHFIGFEMILEGGCLLDTGGGIY